MFLFADDVMLRDERAALARRLDRRHFQLLSGVWNKVFLLFSVASKLWFGVEDCKLASH